MADPATRAHRGVATLALVIGLSAVVTGCSSSKPSGTPSCTDTSTAGSRLAAGCVHNGRTYEAKIEKCTDGTTLYTIPFTPEDGGASAYSNGKLRTRTATTEELVQCTTGQPLSGASSS